VGWSSGNGEKRTRCLAAGEERVILFDLSGHGHFDRSAYPSYIAGELEDFEVPEFKLEPALEHLPEAPALA
jgi:tryptophan synthase beta chain